MQAYKPYLDFLTQGNVCETCYILSHDGQICTTNLPIKEMCRYIFSLEDENDPSKHHEVLVDERVILLEALANKGVAKDKAGIRLYNQKYYTVSYDQETRNLYLKKSKGGACISTTAKYIIIGTFNSELTMTTGVPQNPGELNKRVESLAQQFLKMGS